MLRFVLACVLALPVLGAGCDRGADTRGLSRLRAPAGGVALDYQLEPGTALTGHLRLGKTRRIDGLDTPLSQAVECDVTLVVAPRTAATNAEATRLGASFANVDLAWGLPPASSFASDDFRERALELLRGYRGWIEVDGRGRVVAISPVPERTPAELAELLETLLDTIEASFVPAPEGAVERGGSWQEPWVRGERTGSLAATLQGLYRHRERDEAMALLSVAYEEERKASTPTGTETRGRTGEARVLYATEGGYVAELDRELSAFAPSRGMTYEKLRVTWERTRGLNQQELERPGQDVQIITDPCNPDYVGPEVCDELEPLPQTEVSTQTEAEGESEAEAEGDAEGESEGDSEGDSEGESEAESEGDSEGESKAESEGDSEGESKAESEGDSESKSKSKAESEAPNSSSGNSSSGNSTPIRSPKG